MSRHIATLWALLALSSSQVVAQTWTPPRTPWGDPDLQGNYTNKYEQGTPFERPAEFEGRTLDQIRGDLAALDALGASHVLLDTYTDDAEATRDHERAWRMLAVLAEQVLDLPRATLR